MSLHLAIAIGLFLPVADAVQADMAAHIDKQRLQGFTQGLAGERSVSTANQRAIKESWLRDQLAQSTCGQVQNQTLANPVSSHNLWVRVAAGSPTNAAPVVLGGHWDSMPTSPGADDNADGVAVVLEVAKVFSALARAGCSANRPIEFVALGLHEVGMVGGYQYVQRFSNQANSLHIAIILDSMGFWSNQNGTLRNFAGTQSIQQEFPQHWAAVSNGWRGDWINVHGRTTQTLEASTATSLTAKINTHGNGVYKALDFSCPLNDCGVSAGKNFMTNLRRSDQSAFWDSGLQAVGISDMPPFHYHPAIASISSCADAQLGAGMAYHNPCDTVDRIDWDFLTNNAKGIADALAVLVGFQCQSLPSSLDFSCSMSTTSQTPQTTVPVTGIAARVRRHVWLFIVAMLAEFQWYHMGS